VTPAKIERYDMGDLAGLVPQVLPEVTDVRPDSPAQHAGLRVGDQLRSVDGRPITGTLDFIQYIEQHAGEEVRLRVAREGRLVTVPVVPEDEGGAGKIGIGIGANVYQKYPFFRAIRESVDQNVEIVRQTFALLGKILTGQLSARGNLGGPIEIATQSGAAARRGFTYLLYFMGFISISIAILNLMPIPILDGGQILILCIESVIRRDLPLKIKEAVTQVGFVLIMLLMLMVIWFDIARNWGG
jgi:regulator of sigma E protease